jgi:hypothetical protein
MYKRVRGLPFLRSRSNVEFGVCLAVLLNLGLAFALTASAPNYFRDPSSQFLEAFAGVGGGVFVAYTVGVSNLFRSMRRSADAEALLGTLVGLGLCAILGVGFALLLIDAARPLGLVEHFGFYWAGGSLIWLAGLVASLPLFAYEDARAKHINHDDE